MDGSVSEGSEITLPIVQSVDERAVVPETKSEENRLVMFYAGKWGVDAEHKFPPISEQQMGIMYDFQEKFVESLTSGKLAKFEEARDYIDQVLGKMNAKIIYVDEGSLAVCNQEEAESVVLTNEVILPSVTLFTNQGYSENDAEVLVTLAKAHELGHILDGLTIRNTLPDTLSYQAVTEARQY